jgi:KipI family sensor histidine kinase inhibitor
VTTAPRVLPCGPTAWLVEVDEGTDVLAVSAEAAALEGVVEVVPGAQTVLVQLRTRSELDDVVASLRRLDVPPEPPAFEPGDAEVTLPVVYDGEDLPEVAAVCGLAVDDVIARHAASTYRSAFCGFAPGFAYLVGLDPLLHVPRRDAPRPRVPAGAVAIAAGYSAVYPTASPGGWRLLGHTDVTMFDPSRDPPALLPPGTTVRFEPA